MPKHGKYDYMTINPYDFIVFTIYIKNGIVVNAICDYVFHDCKTFSMPKI